MSDLQFPCLMAYDAGYQFERFGTKPVIRAGLRGAAGSRYRPAAYASASSVAGHGPAYGRCGRAPGSLRSPAHFGSA